MTKERYTEICLEYGFHPTWIEALWNSHQAAIQRVSETQVRWVTKTFKEVGAPVDKPYEGRRPN